MSKKEKLFLEKMQREDLEQIWEIENLSFTSPWSKKALQAELANPRAFYLVAKLEEKVIGYAGCWAILDEGHITNVAVHPEYRKKKVATLLLMKLEHELVKKGVSSLTLEVRVSNEIAQNLYLQRGFRPFGLRKKYYSDNSEDALIMWKTNLKNVSHS